MNGLAKIKSLQSTLEVDWSPRAPDLGADSWEQLTFTPNDRFLLVKSGSRISAVDPQLPLAPSKIRRQT
jgi:hypothetical protein